MIRRWLRKWLGIDEIEKLAHRAELRGMGFNPDDPDLIMKLQMRAFQSDPRNRYVVTNIKVPSGD